MRGLSINAFMIAFVLAAMTLGAIGWYGVAGVDLSTGYTTEVNDTVGDIEQPEAQGVGTDDPGLFGVAVGIWKTMTTIMSMTYKAQAILRSYGIHWSIAYSIQVMIDLSVAITLVSIYRGFRTR